jgi:hypothetical protein
VAERARIGDDGAAPAPPVVRAAPALARGAGNRATARLLARFPDRHPRAAPVPERPGVLEIRVGEVLVATVTARGGAEALERISVRDHSSSAPGRITRLRLEVLHPAELDVEVRLEPGAPEALRRFGITDIDLEQTGGGTPAIRSELEIWPPPLTGDDGPGRIRTDAEERRLQAEERSRQRRVRVLRRQLERVRSRVASDKELHEALIENAEDQPIVSAIADFLGGTDVPSRAIWNETDRLLADAERALDGSDTLGAAKAVLRALEAQRAAQKKLGTHRERTIRGAERGVKGLETARAAGSVASILVPGPLGTILSHGDAAGEAVGDAIFGSDPREQGGIPIFRPGGPGWGPATRLPRGKNALRPGRDRLRQYDMDHYGTFSNRPRDKLAGHELLQNKWLNLRGLADRRGKGDYSRRNPAVALGKEMHKRVGREQRRLGLFDKRKLEKMSARENIELNAEAMKRAGVPDYVIEVLKRDALRHAAMLPL